MSHRYGESFFPTDTEYSIVITVLFGFFMCRPINITSYTLPPFLVASNVDATMWLRVGWVAGSPLSWVVGIKNCPINTQTNGHPMAKSLVVDFLCVF